MKGSRRWSIRAVRNLIVFLALLLIIWGQFGAPMPTARMEFRRLEDRNLLPHSQICLTLEGQTDDGDGYTAVVGTWERQAAVGYLFQRYRGRNDVELWDLEEGPSPIPLYYTMSRTLEGDVRRVGNGLLFLQVPDGVTECRATIAGRTPTAQTETVQGEPLGGGIWLFWFGADVEERPIVYQNQALEGLPYTLEGFGVDGEPLLTQEGTIPEQPEL